MLLLVMTLPQDLDSEPRRKRVCSPRGSRHPHSPDSLAAQQRAHVAADVTAVKQSAPGKQIPEMAVPWSKGPPGGLQGAKFPAVLPGKRSPAQDCNRPFQKLRLAFPFAVNQDLLLLEQPP